MCMVPSYDCFWIALSAVTPCTALWRGACSLAVRPIGGASVRKREIVVHKQCMLDAGRLLMQRTLSTPLQHFRGPMRPSMPRQAVANESITLTRQQFCHKLLAHTGQPERYRVVLHYAGPAWPIGKKSSMTRAI
jgi:hypothetical protein